MKTKAVIVVESNAPVVIEEVEIPKLECGQVLVKIYRSGICGAQLNEIHAVKGVDKFLPHLLGHEGGGIVQEIGPGVSNVKVGDRVVLHWKKGAGIHAATPKYRWGSKTVNAGWVTTFQEYSIVSENRLTVVPQETPFEIAALMGCAVTTALGVVNNDANVKIGESFAVLGCGGVGLNLIQGAQMVSADPIIGIDKVDVKLKMASELGATDVINSSSQNIEDQVRKIAGAKGVDVFIETTGNPRLIELAYKLTAPQGRTILVGVPRHNEDITIHSLPLHFGKVLTGCEGGHTNPTTDIPRYVSLYLRGKLTLDGLVTDRFKLEDANKALDRLRSGEAGRCMLEICD